MIAPFLTGSLLTLFIPVGLLVSAVFAAMPE